MALGRSFVPKVNVANFIALISIVNRTSTLDERKYARCLFNETDGIVPELLLRSFSTHIDKTLRKHHAINLHIFETANHVRTRGTRRADSDFKLTQ